MKVLGVLFLVHVTACGVIGYCFRERIVMSHQEFNPPIDTTTAEERARGQASLLMAQEHIIVRFPSAVIAYAIAGLLALLIGFSVEIYRILTART